MSGARIIAILILYGFIVNIILLLVMLLLMLFPDLVIFSGDKYE